MNRIKRTHARKLAAFAAIAVLVPAAQAQADTANDTSQFDVTPGALEFTLDPSVPNLPGLTLTGEPETLEAAMSAWEVRDATGSAEGWKVTVQGDNFPGKSAVFKEYCTDGTPINGCDTAVFGAPGPGYVTTDPEALAANSLTLDSNDAAFSAVGGSAGGAPTHSCSLGCSVDSASPKILASAAAGNGMGTWKADNYAATSLKLSAPTTVEAIGFGNKVYRVDLLHTLASGPN